MKVQAQHMKPGDVVGSGETVVQVIVNSTQWDSSRVHVTLKNEDGRVRSSLWKKYTQIGVTRK